MNLLKAECSNQVIEHNWNKKIGPLSSENTDNNYFPKISVNLMVKNEERCIKRCLQKLISFADELIIVDTGSTDKTVEIIKSFDSSLPIFHKEWENDFSEIRNFMMKHSSHNWIMHLDADETLDEDFTEIKKLLAMCEAEPINCFYFISPRIQNSNGQIFTLTRRIFQNYQANKYVGIIHEELRVKSHEESYIVDLLVDGKIFHDGYEKHIMQQKNKFNRNVQKLEIMTEKEPDNPRWSYFLARDAYNGLNELPKYTIENIKSLLYQTTKMGNSFPQAKEFIEASYVLLEEIFLKKKEWSALQSWNKVLRKNFPDNADSYYFELLLNQHNTYNSQNVFLQDIFQQLEETEATNSRIDSNLFHLLYALASLHYQNGNISQSANFLEELPVEMQKSFIEYYQKQLQYLHQILQMD
jgi:glycosyltransferase involved in cell wall biosynthesis